MALVKIADFNPNYKEQVFGGEDIKGFDVYAGTGNEKIGSVYDALLDETGRFRYLVIDTGLWIFGKKVLLPVGSSRIDYQAHRVYATGIRSKDQAESLPQYHEDMTVDYDYEESVRGVYRTPNTAAKTTYNRSNYSYDSEPNLYNVNEQDHQNLKLYEERLIANKERHKAGEVKVGKRVETETARAAVPVEKEKVVIERSRVSDAQPIAPGEANFQAGEVARMEVYEEDADIHKEAYVREEVGIRKEVERDTVQAEEQLRREELDVQKKGNPKMRKDR
jgi:uncharacterized protein (TIGR02271 family)